VSGVRKTVHGEAELCGVERKGFEQESEPLEPGDRGLMVRKVPQQLVEALAEKGVDGFGDREMCVLSHGERTPGLLVEPTSLVDVRRPWASGRRSLGEK
jgi:hypothetical protein